MGLGAEDQLDDFEEYDENESLKIKDTTFQSDQLQTTFFMNIAAAKKGNGDQGEETTRDSNLIIPVRATNNQRASSGNVMHQ